MRTALVGEKSSGDFDLEVARLWLRPSMESMKAIIQLGAFQGGQSWARLHGTLGLRWDAACNLMWPSKSDFWLTTRTAKIAAMLRHPDLLGEFDRVVLCGTRVQRAFGYNARLGDVWRDGQMCGIPHPSGRCRAWNDPHKIAEAMEMLAWKQ